MQVCFDFVLSRGSMGDVLKTKGGGPAGQNQQPIQIS